MASHPDESDITEEKSTPSSSVTSLHSDPFSTPKSLVQRPGYIYRNDSTTLSPGSQYRSVNYASGTSTPSVARSASSVPLRPRLNRMRSTMVTPENPVSKPWEDTKGGRAVLSYVTTYTMILLGVIAGGLQCYFSYAHARLDRKALCLVLDEDFSDPSKVFGDGGTFFREVDMSGFGNGQFDMTTASDNNSYVKDGQLYIVPTLTSDILGSDAIFNNSIYNITGCTYNITQGSTWHTADEGTTSDYNFRLGEFDDDAYYQACSAVSNATTGQVINPVQSARLTTRGRSSIKYGRVEIKAKMPLGDWLWPALWMLPADNVYGPWPLSGEIDIVESRGNGPKYTFRGSNYVQGSLNWGPISFLNGVSKTYSWWTERRSQFNEDFHTYALEWTTDFLRIYVDSRLHTLLDLKFDKPFFERGDFPPTVHNGSTEINLDNPWVNGTNATPFDQDFYLILNVAVGGTNGWFPDGQGKKPWLDRSNTAMRDFAQSQDVWYSTWGKDDYTRGMVVDYVKMWNHCDGN